MLGLAGPMLYLGWSRLWKLEVVGPWHSQRVFSVKAVPSNLLGYRCPRLWKVVGFGITSHKWRREASQAFPIESQQTWCWVEACQSSDAANEIAEYQNMILASRHSRKTKKSIVIIMIIMDCLLLGDIFEVLFADQGHKAWTFQISSELVDFLPGALLPWCRCACVWRMAGRSFGALLLRQDVRFCAEGCLQFEQTRLLRWIPHEKASKEATFVSLRIWS